jgi:selenocysteine lyase/cysteine desulfurase
MIPFGPQGFAPSGASYARATTHKEYGMTTLLPRREFLVALAAPAVACAAPRLESGRARAALACAAVVQGDPELFWGEIARAFTVDRGMVNLNNGGVSPSPRFVQEAMKRHLDVSNEAPAYTMWRILEPEREGVRARLAQAFGVDPEEVAITRNASESLQICQLGLELARGDEVLTTNQDYPRMITTFKQRARREGIVLKQFSIPTPCEDPAEIVRRFEANLTPRTRLILVSHVVYLTGQVLPVAEVVALGRRHGIPVIVDGAHALAHLDFRIEELGCDFYASSLHKWLFAPHGTGLLYVRRDRIPALWPLMAAEEKQGADIRKFEEIGTHPAANALAIAEALVFHETLGPARKLARLVELREHWAEPLARHERVRFHTSRKPGFAGGFALVEIEGVDPDALATHLWEKHKIFTVSIRHEEFRGIRVSPSVYTLKSELDRFVEAMESVIRDGLPG